MGSSLGQLQAGKSLQHKGSKAITLEQLGLQS